jgi:DNA damage-inducible protein 1
MRITVSNEQGDIRTVEFNSEIELESLKALLRADFGLSEAINFDILFNGAIVTGSPKQANVQNNDILLLKTHKVQQPESRAEQVRQQILHDPQMRNQIIAQNPLMREALQDPAQFSRIFGEMNRLMQQQQQQQQPTQSYDEMDPEAQIKIEEEIRQRNINTNMETAMEYHPESFARVIMLYIQVIIKSKESAKLMEYP